jgi:replicative DNA helicase
MGLLEELRSSESYSMACLYAEETLLGTLFFSRETVEDLNFIFNLLNPEDFWGEDCKILYKGAQDCFSSGQPVNMASVLRVVRDSLKTNTVKPEIVTRLALVMPVQSNLMCVAQSIKESAVARNIANTLSIASGELLSAASPSLYLTDLIGKLDELKNDLRGFSHA